MLNCQTLAGPVASSSAHRVFVHVFLHVLLPFCHDRSRQYRWHDAGKTQGEQDHAEQVHIAVVSGADDQRRQGGTDSQSQHLQGDRMDNHAPSPVETRDDGEQQWGHDIGGIVEYTYGDAIDQGSHETEQKHQRDDTAKCTEGQDDYAVKAHTQQGHGEGAGYAKELGNGQARRHLLLCTTACRTDEKEVGPDHALGQEIVQNSRECQKSEVL